MSKTATWLVCLLAILCWLISLTACSPSKQQIVYETTLPALPALPVKPGIEWHAFEQGVYLDAMDALSLYDYLVLMEAWQTSICEIWSLYEKSE